MRQCHESDVTVETLGQPRPGQYAPDKSKSDGKETLRVRVDIGADRTARYTPTNKYCGDWRPKQIFFYFLPCNCGVACVELTDAENSRTLLGGNESFDPTERCLGLPLYD